MKKNTNHILVSIFMMLLMFTSCKKTECTINHSPTEPTIKVGDIDATGAILNWKASTDIDGDAITYDVYVLDIGHTLKFKVASDVTLTTFNYTTTINPKTVIVVAKDGKGGETTGVGTFYYYL
jgi:hypothetical protein